VTAKILTIDIENFPHLGYVWDLWNQNLGINQIKQVGRVVCFAAKWLGNDEIEYYSDFHDGHEVMVRQAYRLLDQADIVVGYNSKGFDIPKLKTEMLMLDRKLKPSSFQQVDLYQVAKKEFKFASNKLDYIAQQLEIGQKVGHAGFQLWIDCMNGDIDAWAKMREYNKHDVVLTEELYLDILPWISNHPNVNVFSDDEVEGCTRCGSMNYQRRGYYTTTFAKYQQCWCKDCGGWFSFKTAEKFTEFRSK